MAKTWLELGLMTGWPPPADKTVTLANYDQAPFQRWSFINMRELIPSALIPKSPVTKPLRRNIRDLSDFRFAHNGADHSLADILDTTYVDAMMVIHNDEVIFEHFEQGVYPSTPHIAQSVTKSFVATLAGILIGRGEFDASKLVTDYLPELAGTSGDDCDLQMVLDMRTGTAFDESDYEDADSESFRGFRILGWLPRLADDPTPAQYIAELKNVREHNTIFEYRSILTDVLGWCLERAAQKPLAELIAHEIWAPMGAEFDANMLVGPLGFPMSSGGLCLSISDLARFGLMHLHGGRVGDNQVVPAEWVADLSNNDEALINAYKASTHAEEDKPGNYYHNQWWVYDGPNQIYAGMGINGQQVYVHTPSNTVIAKFSSWPRPWIDELADFSQAGLTALCESLMNGAES